MFAFTKKINIQAGFSIVEFVVVLVIFSIMSSVTIFNYNDYRGQIKETNVTQDIALSVRQAQVYGLSSSDRVVGDQDLDEDGVADDVFGINNPSNPYFDGQILDITQDRSIRGVAIYPGLDAIIIFEDLNRNFRFDEGTDRIIDRREVQIGGVDIVGVDICNGQPNCGNLVTDKIDIVFQRPYPDAYISQDITSPQGNTFFDFASIVISAGNETQSYIEVNSTGNITVKKNYE